MKTSFESNFEAACLESLGDLATAKMKNDPEQKANEAETKALRTKLIEKLDGKTDLLNNYDNAFCLELCNDRIWLYQQGFQDCVCLLRWIGII